MSVRLLEGPRYERIHRDHSSSTRTVLKEDHARDDDNAQSAAVGQFISIFYV